ncbi:LysM peptidoglycan-binding domain-containing protein [Elusimicrobiota bacterium]
MKRTCLLFFVLLNANILTAELVEVEVRTGDTLHGFAEKYLKDINQWPSIYELNKKTIKDPNRIFPKERILIPVEMLKEEVGDLVKIVKEVKVKKRESRSWRKGKKQERMFPEDGIRTGGSSSARVNFLVGSHIEVAPDSLIYLKPTIRKTAVASLLEGGLNVKETKVITPSAEIIPKKNSQYDVNVDNNKVTKVSVFNGEVDVKAQGKIVTVLKGYRTIVKMNKMPEDPVFLPLSGEEALEFQDEFAKNSNITFLLRVAPTERFNELEKDLKVEALTRKTIREGLSPGQHFWKAAVIDTDGFQGEYSDPRAIYIGIKTNSVLELTGFKVINKEEGIIEIIGNVRNANKIIINGYPGDLDSAGNFKSTIIIPEDQNIITATAFGSEGIVIRKYRMSDENGIPNLQILK